MTLGTIRIADLHVGSPASSNTWFEPLFEDTAEPAFGEPNASRRELLQKLVDLSTSEASLDWDALARINIEGWGADVDSE